MQQVTLFHATCNIVSCGNAGNLRLQQSFMQLATLTSFWLYWQARCSGVWSFSLVLLSSNAPCRRNSSTSPRCPTKHALCRGVWPSRSVQFTDSTDMDMLWKGREGAGRLHGAMITVDCSPSSAWSSGHIDTEGDKGPRETSWDCSPRPSQICTSPE